MSANEDKIGTLEELFKAELKEPFHYKLSLTDVRNNAKDIFESMRKMYTMGLVIHFGNQEQQSVDIQRKKEKCTNTLDVKSEEKIDQNYLIGNFII